MPVVWEAPRFLAARSQARRELSMEAARKLGGFPIQQREQASSPPGGCDNLLCWSLLPKR